jgi:hypothetical protein
MVVFLVMGVEWASCFDPNEVIEGMGMARWWREPYTDEKAQAAGIHDWEWHTVIGSPNAQWIYYVEVCQFTFAFFSLAMIRQYLEFYSTKILPSSRMRGPLWHQRGENQRWFERLPMRLRKEPKRQRVVKALEGALTEFAADESRDPRESDGK